MSEHWTRAYLGRCYDSAGIGPMFFNCWTFFGLVQRQQFGRELPEPPAAEKLAAIVRVFREGPDAFGWRKLEGGETRRDGDGVLLSHRNQPHHIGVYVATWNQGGVLHCLPGPGSVLQSLLHLELGAWNIVGVYRPREA